MKFLLATKQEMTQVFSDDGMAHPVTVLRSGPLVVTAVKTEESDGYRALQVGFGPIKIEKMNKAQRGALKGGGGFRYLAEFRLAEKEEPRGVSEEIPVSIFKAGDEVNVSAVSKGKGFQGVVKRHGFHGGSRTHGQKHSEREGGAIGGGGRAGGRVVKGMRMPGRMGGKRVTVQNLKVIEVNPENGLIAVRGAVPGRRGSLVEIWSPRHE